MINEKQIMAKLDRFDRAAQAWGWYQDQASNEIEEMEAHEDYKSTKEDLIKALKELLAS